MWFSSHFCPSLHKTAVELLGTFVTLLQLTQLLPLVYTGVCRCTIGLNVALMVLFLSLSVTFFLLAAGQTNTKCMKASQI